MARQLDLTVSLSPGGEVFNRTFTRWISDLEDLTPAFNEMITAFTAYERQVFSTQGASSGSPWAPLAAGTKARKGHGVILVDTGALRADILRPGIREVQARRMALGTRLRYAVFHQQGTRRMPARPIIRLTEGFKQDWTRIIHRHLLASAAGR